jgi:hypothetical protein
MLGTFVTFTVAWIVTAIIAHVASGFLFDTEWKRVVDRIITTVMNVVLFAALLYSIVAR